MSDPDKNTDGDRHPTAQLPEKVAKTTGADIAAITTKVGLGLIPVVGSAAAEIVSAIIPGQRLDRIQGFLEKLADKISHLEQAIVEQKMKSPEGVDLLEDCFVGASRALSDDRLEYLSNLYATGITSDIADHETNKKMVSLLNQLTDAEVIWLGALAQFRPHRDRTERHEGVLNPRVAYLGSPVDEVDAQAVQRSWKDRLVQLGLAEMKIRRPFRGEAVEFDQFTGDWKRDSPEATWLGRMLLGYIGIDEPLRSRRGAPEEPESDGT